MSIGLASENRLPEAYEAKTHDDGLKVTIQSGSKHKTVINTNSFASVANILSAFSPDGKASLQPGATLAIKDEFSGRSITIVASAIGDVAAALKAFVVQEGEYLPAYEESEAASASSPSPSVDKSASSFEHEAVETGSTTTSIDVDTVSAVKPVTGSGEKTTSIEVPEPVSPRQVDQSSTAHAEGQPVIAKRRGRPKKNQELSVQPEVSRVPQEVPTPAVVVTPMAQDATDVVPKKRGRPKKVVAPVEQETQKTSATVEAPVSNVQAEVHEAPKKRGRPRKDASSSVQLTPPAAVLQKTPGVESPTPSKRRGRPPKANLVQEVASSSRPVSVVKALAVSAQSNLLPPALVEDHLSSELDLDGLPDYLKASKRFM